MKNEFDNAILQIDGRIQRTLFFLPESIKQNVDEIRIRAGLPVCLTVNGKVLFVCKDSTVSKLKNSNCYIASYDELEKTLSLLCNNSVYLHESEIKNGYISLKNGNRAGVCGVFNADGMLTEITSVNIRIARQIFGVALPLLSLCNSGGMLIAGPPASGKTTMLRDLIRLLSSGAGGEYRRVAVIDSRGEISGGFSGRCVNDLGENTDVLYTRDKALGTQIALRTMFPEFIAFDEIGTKNELQSVVDCFNAGVSIITTAHCHDVNDIMHRAVTASIVKSGAVSNVVLLSQSLGAPPQIFNVKEFFANVAN